MGIKKLLAWTVIIVGKLVTAFIFLFFVVVIGAGIYGAVQAPMKALSAVGAMAGLFALALGGMWLHEKAERYLRMH